MTIDEKRQFVYKDISNIQQDRFLMLENLFTNLVYEKIKNWRYFGQIS